MPSHGPDEPSGRETRLLVLVVAVAFAVLLLLARFRFPASELSAVSTSPAPLSGLVSRATFDDMAETMTAVLSRVSPSVVIVQLEPAATESTAGRATARGTRGGGPGLGLTPRAAPPQPSRAPYPAPALRVRANLALVYVPSGMRPIAAPGLDVPIEVVASDIDRNLVLIRTGGLQGVDGMPGAMRSYGGFSYVALVDATVTGPTVQPVFIGRADPLKDTRWSQALTALGTNAGLSPGTLLFSMSGRFIGMITNADSGRAIIPVPAMEALVNRLAGGEQGGTQ